MSYQKLKYFFVRNMSLPTEILHMILFYTSPDVRLVCKTFNEIYCYINQKNIKLAEKLAEKFDFAKFKITNITHYSSPSLIGKPMICARKRARGIHINRANLRGKSYIYSPKNSYGDIIYAIASYELYKLAIRKSSMYSANIPPHKRQDERERYEEFYSHYAYPSSTEFIDLLPQNARIRVVIDFLNKFGRRNSEIGKLYSHLISS